MRFFLVLPLLSIAFALNAQNGMEQQIDSLENELKIAKTDTTKVNIMCLLTRAYGGIDSVKTFHRGFEALKISKKIGYEKGIMDAYIALGGGFMDYFNLEKAEEYLKSGIAQADKAIAKDSSKQNLKLWIRGNYNLGVTYGYKGDHDAEIAYAQKTIPIAERIGDTIFVAVAHTNLAIKYLDFKRYPEAYKSFMKSGALYEQLNNPDDFVYDGLFFSELLYEMDSLSKMKKTLTKVKTYLDKVPNSINWHLYHSYMGMYLTGIGKYDKAIAFYDKSSVILEKTKRKVFQKELLEKYAETYYKMGDLVKAKEQMYRFQDIALKEENKQHQFEARHKLAKYEAESKNFKKAYLNLSEAIKISDILVNERTQENMRRLELQYQTSQKEKEILALKNENNKSALSLEKKKSQGYLMGIAISALAFLLLMGYLFYHNKLRKARKKERIREVEVNELKQEQQTKIFSAMIEGQEKERKRLAIDLHDGLGGRLSGISLNLSKLDKDEPKGYPKKKLQKVMKDLDDSLTELRSIARNMMPETLVKFGLRAALKDYCSSMNSSNTKVTLQFYGSDKGIGINQQVTMYRIIQELINNAIKHAKASEVLVQYIREGNQVDITVEDNGVGLNNEVLKNESSGMGLSNLRTRVAYLKGNLDFQTEENEGTTVNVHINIDAA
ncbi:Sensor histidine kinase [hydrothermal vent metagenome]|uniref:histidine kinase n=1 Tax=hydrothermal vent metagenome TaxID=652676 RepID=A0A3B0TJK1_9ZZZZ